MSSKMPAKTTLLSQVVHKINRFHPVLQIGSIFSYELTTVESFTKNLIN